MTTSTSDDISSLIESQLKKEREEAELRLKKEWWKEREEANLSLNKELQKEMEEHA
eukprot:CAMPEP_0194311874 /NCGR_PEP_ID=MMETSP0171-20130528/8802_1 /TAXON_ID=218684 /ORGANISM="Corethron pennatum, Strain L29A3" /LENGTH=55 /DNA_ID=CAMNT_0039066141 /DNA_START=57 /DNA_END=221 /DNA_ORIENTATION=-